MLVGGEEFWLPPLIILLIVVPAALLWEAGQEERTVGVWEVPEAVQQRDEEEGGICHETTQATPTRMSSYWMNHVCVFLVFISWMFIIELAVSRSRNSFVHLICACRCLFLFVCINRLVCVTSHQFHFMKVMVCHEFLLWCVADVTASDSR